MKKILIIMFLLIFSVGCGVLPSGYLGHSTNTQVVLSEANYKIVATVSAQSEAMTLFGIGPTNEKLYAQAKSNLYREIHQSLDLKDQSYALINITSDVSLNFFTAIFLQKTVTISADVIVFERKVVKPK